MRLVDVKLEYIKDGERVIEKFASDGESVGVSWEVTNRADRFTVDILSDDEIELVGVTANFSHLYSEDDRIFLNGYQSWTSCREHTLVGRLHGIYRLPKLLVDRFAFDKYGDYTFVEYGRGAGQLHGFTYGYIRREGDFFLMASLAEKSGFTVIRTDTNRKTVRLEKDCCTRVFKGAFRAFDMALLRGGEDEVFDEYFRLLGIPKCTAPRIKGYTSWYNRYENITEESVTSDLEGFVGGDTLPDVFQIDDGYESTVGDWLDVDLTKFPSGMKSISERIKSYGMEPGIWLAPFAAEKESKLVSEHPDWLLRDESGEAVVGGSNWSGFYGLDIYNEDLRDYLRRVFKTVIDDWGYRLLKLDFLYACCIVPRPDKTRAEIMYDGMDFIRELCGDAKIIGCGVPLAPAFGEVEYCRIGCDVSLSWDDAVYMRPMHSERPSTKKSVLGTIFRRELDGRAFRCDPDVYLLRDENMKMSEEERLTLAVCNALFGGVLFTSDNPASYGTHAKKTYELISNLTRDDLVEVHYANKTVTVKYKAHGRTRKVEIKLGARGK